MSSHSPTAVATVNGLSGVGAVVVGGLVVDGGDMAVVVLIVFVVDGLVGTVVAGVAVVVVGRRVVVVPGAPMVADVGGGTVPIRTMPARSSGGGSSGDAQLTSARINAHPTQPEAWRGVISRTRRRPVANPARRRRTE